MSLNQVGTVQDQNANLDIPLVHTTSLDRQVWHYNKNGVYFVKSGYWVALKGVREQGIGDNGDRNRSRFYHETKMALWDPP